MKAGEVIAQGELVWCVSVSRHVTQRCGWEWAVALCYYKSIDKGAESRQLTRRKSEREKERQGW